MQLSTPKWAIAGNLAFCAAINYADRSALSAVLPALHSEMGLSDMELAALGSVFLWSYALFSPVAGFLADRWSRSRLIVISVASWSLVSVAAGFSVNYAMLLTTRILLGLTESLYLPSATALIADYHGTSSRGTAMAVHSVGLNLGVVAGGAGAGYLADHFGWRMGFIVLGGMGLLIAGLSLFFLRDSGAGLPQKAQKHPVLASVGELARIRSYVVVLAEVMLVATGVWTFFNWLPLYFRDTFQMSLGSAGFAGTFTLQIATVAGMVMSGYWSDRLATRSRRNRMLLQSMSFLAAAPFLLVFRTQPGFLLVSFSIFLFALLRGMGQANDSPVLCDVVPSRLRSTAIGFMNTCASFSGGLGVFATGYLKSKYGLAGVFSGISIAFLSAGVILLAGYRFFSARDLLRQGEKQT